MLRDHDEQDENEEQETEHEVKINEEIWQRNVSGKDKPERRGNGAPEGMRKQEKQERTKRD